jgi:hypothetical protein
MGFQFPLLADSSAGPQLWDNILNLLASLWGIAVSLVELAAPWTPLLAWIVFWLFAVNWVKLRQVMIRGGWIGVVLIGLVMVLVWGSVAPPSGQTHHIFGLTLSNYVGKTVYVTVLFCIMFLCGSVQLAGFAPACCQFPEEEPEPTHGSPDHGAAHH